MKKARRTEEQIIGILQEHEAGARRTAQERGQRYTKDLRLKLSKPVSSKHKLEKRTGSTNKYWIPIYGSASRIYML